jgi:hypothetical protein
MTAHAATEEQVTATIVYSSPTRYPQNATEHPVRLVYKRARAASVANWIRCRSCQGRQFGSRPEQRSSSAVPHHHVSSKAWSVPLV